jgi:hypothetical protein
MSDVPPDPDLNPGPAGGGQTAVAAFFALVSLAALALLGQWLASKLTQPEARMDIAEWPFMILGAALALLPLIAAIGLLRRRPFGSRLGRVTAYLIAVVGGVALLIALAQLTMGVAWTLLLGGAVLLIGAIVALRVLRPAGRALTAGRS